MRTAAVVRCNWRTDSVLARLHHPAGNSPMAWEVHGPDVYAIACPKHRIDVGSWRGRTSPRDGYAGSANRDNGITQERYLALTIGIADLPVRRIEASTVRWLPSMAESSDSSNRVTS